MVSYIAQTPTLDHTYIAYRITCEFIHATENDDIYAECSHYRRVMPRYNGLEYIHTF